MSTQKLNLILIIILAIVLMAVTSFLYTNIKSKDQKISELQKGIDSLQNKIESLEDKNKQLTGSFESYKKMQEEKEDRESLVKKALSEDIIKYGLDSGVGTMNAAILLQEKEFCDLLGDSSSKELCLAIFNDECVEEYDYPNREMCARKRLFLKRNVDITQIKSLCNNRSLMEHDMSQAHCYQYFANALDKPELCKEICKRPIDNTNCGACSTTNEAGEYISCAEKYKQDCLENTE